MMNLALVLGRMKFSDYVAQTMVVFGVHLSSFDQAFMVLKLIKRSLFFFGVLQILIKGLALSDSMMSDFKLVAVVLCGQGLSGLDGWDWQGDFEARAGVAVKR